jgi:hypothetical protein
LRGIFFAQATNPLSRRSGNDPCGAAIPTSAAPKSERSPMAAPKKHGPKPNVRSLLDRLAGEEQAFLEREFLAPAMTGGSVQVRIGAVVCKLAVQPADFRGFGVFRPSSHTQARLVRSATLAERRQYLALFPLVRLILCRQTQHTWYGSAASFGDGRIELDGAAPVLLAEEVQRFDTVCTRFDGSSFWFDEIDPRHDPAAAPFLRAALAERVPPDELERKGLSAEQCAAYELNYWELVRAAEPEEDDAGPQRNPQHRRRSRRQPGPPAEIDPVRRRLQESLSHAGANLIDYLERGDSFRVTYLVGGRRYTSAVNKQDLSVQVAGICLSGEDQKFDLASLVGVLREGEGGHHVVPVGDDNAGMDEEQYWHANPPRRP